jgi:hypothetical protein
MTNNTRLQLPSGYERSPLRLTKRGQKTVAAGVGIVAAAFIGTGIASHPDTSADTSAKVICEVPVKSGDTPWDIAGKLDVSSTDVKFYHPGETVPETKPAYELQPGDMAVVRIGATACNGAGGIPEDINNPSPGA